MNYAIMIVVICVAHLYACIKVSRDIIANESTGNRISLMTLGFFSGWDVFLCLFHLYNALTVDVRLIIIYRIFINIGLLPIICDSSILLFHPSLNLRNKTYLVGMESQILRPTRRHKYSQKRTYGILP